MLIRTIGHKRNRADEGGEARIPSEPHGSTRSDQAPVAANVSSELSEFANVGTMTAVAIAASRHGPRRSSHDGRGLFWPFGPEPEQRQIARIFSCGIADAPSALNVDAPPHRQCFPRTGSLSPSRLPKEPSALQPPRAGFGANETCRLMASTKPLECAVSPNSH